jgi:type IV secretory pathway protease TraF
MSAFADHRRYLPHTAYLLKPVAAVAGDRICRFGARIFVRHHFTAQAITRDWLARPLPSWQGCRTLRIGEIFLLADGSNSFDSRYFGAIGAGQVAGTAFAVWPARLN